MLGGRLLWGRLIWGLLLGACGAAPPAGPPRLLLPPETVLYGGSPQLEATLRSGVDFIRHFVPVPDPGEWLRESLAGVEPAARLDGPWHFIVLQLPEDRVGVVVLLPLLPGSPVPATPWRPATFAGRAVAAGALRDDTAILTDVPEWADAHREQLGALRAFEPRSDVVARVTVERFYDRGRWASALTAGSPWEREPTLDFMAQVAESELALSFGAAGLVADVSFQPRPGTAFARWAAAVTPLGEATLARVPARSPLVVAGDFSGAAWKPVIDVMARVEEERLKVEGESAWDRQRQRLTDALAGDLVMGVLPGPKGGSPAILANFKTRSDASVRQILDAPPGAPVLYEIAGVPVRALSVGEGAEESPGVLNQAEVIVRDGLLWLAGGDGTRPILEALIAGTLDRGLAANTALAAAFERAGPVFFIVSCNVLELLRLTPDAEIDKALGDLRSSSALALSAAATEGALRLRLDLPLDHLQALWQLMTRMQSSGGDLPRRLGLPDWI